MNMDIMSSGYVSTHQMNMIVARSRRCTALKVDLHYLLATVLHKVKVIHCQLLSVHIMNGVSKYNVTIHCQLLYKCPYYEWSKYNVTTPGYISLPVLLTELNNYMCGPLNRKV